MSAQNLFLKLETNQPFFSSGERRIADLILKEPQLFINCSMADAAQLAGVSQGSLNNFARKISGGGFAALKLQLAQQLPEYIPAQEQETFNSVAEGDGVKDVLCKSVSRISRAFLNTAELNGEEALRNTVSLIRRAKRIEIYGIYQSGLAATDFYYQLLRLGLPAVVVTEVLMCSVSATMLDKDSLVIAISSSGKTKDILDAVKIAKERKVPVVCITSNSNGPIARFADEVLVTLPSKTSISERMDETHLSQLFLIDCLCSYIRHQTDEDGAKQFYRLEGILNSHSVDD